MRGWSLSLLLCCHLTVSLSHGEGLSMEQCHGRHGKKGVNKYNGRHGEKATVAKRALDKNVMTPMVKRSWTPWKESFQGRMVLQNDESSCFIVMSHHGIPFPIGHSLLPIGYSLLAIPYWLFTIVWNTIANCIEYSLLATIPHWPFPIDYSPVWILCVDPHWLHSLLDPHCARKGGSLPSKLEL